MNNQKLTDALEDLWEVVCHQEHDPVQANGINRAISLICGFPDDNPWIPVGKIWPKANDRQKVWITEKCPAGVHAIKGIWCHNQFKNANGMPMKFEAIAWKPYIPPEPYKEVSKE